jgi:hypothetical protein
LFNDRYGLTDAVIEGRKIMTRRMINLNSTSDVQVRIFAGYVQIIGGSGNVCAEKKLPYKVGEVVAVAQSYEQAYCQGNMDADDAIIRGLKYDPGMSNKMYVRADLMPHQIRITGIRCERLQDISDAECMKEGVRVEFAKNGRLMYYYFDIKRWREVWFDTPREAFSALIDKVSGRGTWDRNPWVVAYEFELVK